mgnify:CR=1 FL=1|tara:strand:+ start:99 stop:464 length:366 start_codon:yes stop_codon:yes gene_type:complete
MKLLPLRKFIIRTVILSLAFLSIAFLPGLAYAVDIEMGSGGNLVFNPSEVTISAGETVKFINNDLPPHNVVFINGHDELSRPDLNFMKGDTVEIAFDDPGEYEFQCEPHAGAGMKGVIHVE